MLLRIKNMVCNRCKMVVKAELEKIGFFPISVELGEVNFEKLLSESDKDKIEAVLLPLGFAIIDDRKSYLVEQIKTQIVQLVQHHNSVLKTTLSDFLSQALNHDYNYLSNLFSDIENTTIEKYFIAQKIEKVKELLVYDELTLSEIAYLMNYSSPAHLSNQFKKVTGLTPSHFKTIGVDKRKPLDKV